MDNPITPSRKTNLGRRRRRAEKRRRAVRRALLALVVIAALAAVIGLALGHAAGGGSPGAPASGPPRSGGTLTVSFATEPASLDPAVAFDAESWSIERLTYQTLLTYASKPGAAGTRLVPDLATALPTVANGGISDGGRVYTFHLKPTIKFAPPIGTVVTASDFKWSFERMLKQPRAAGTYFYTGIVGAQAYLDGTAKSVSGVKVVNQRTIQITLEKPDAAFLYTMAMPFTSVMSQAWCARVGAQIDHKPLGTGPYVIQSWTPGREIVAARNPNFASQGRKGQQYVDTMSFLFSSSADAALGSLGHGQVDVLGDAIPPADYQKTVQSSQWGKYVVNAPQLAMYYLFLNLQVKPFESRTIRTAISYAIDTQKLQKLLDGQGQQLTQIYPQGLPGHVAGAQSQFYAHDPAEAKHLLARAGFPNGFSTTLYADNIYPQPLLAKAIQSDLAAVGIHATITTLDPETYWNFITLTRSHAGIGLGNWYADFPDPADWIGPLFTSPTDGSNNSSFYQNPQVTHLYDAASSQLDPAKRLRMFRQMQALVMHDAPVVPLFQPIWNGMRGNDTGGFYIHPVWIYDFQEYWKLNGH